MQNLLLLLLNKVFVSLILTVIIELIIGFLIGLRKKNELLLLILINILTNPLVNLIDFLNASINLIDRNLLLLLLEIFVVFIEYLLIRLVLKYSNSKSLFISLAINLVSYFTGLLIFTSPLV